MIIRSSRVASYMAGLGLHPKQPDGKILPCITSNFYNTDMATGFFTGVWSVRNVNQGRTALFIFARVISKAITAVSNIQRCSASK